MTVIVEERVQPPADSASRAVRSGPTNLTGRIGRWSADHPWRSIIVWLLLVALAVLAGKAVGSVQLTGARSGSGSAGRAMVAADKAFPLHATEQVLVRSPNLTATQPQFQSAVSGIIQRVEATGRITNLHSPYAPDDAGQISRDEHSALIQFEVTGKLDSADKRVGPIQAAVAAAARDNPQMTISEAGDASIAKTVNSTVNKDLKKAEQLSLPITLFVLLFTFGALIAALLPLALALSAIAAAGGLLAFASHLTALSSPSNSILLLIGLAVGVDYSLFYLKREREERAAGKTKSEALQAAAATSGRSVLISGITVAIAMAGLFLSGSPITYGIGWAAILVVGVAVTGSLTVLPAMLSLLGDKVNRGRIPLVSRHAGRSGRIWAPVIDKVLRRPVLAVVLAGGALLALSVPVLGMRTATPGATDLPQNLPVLQTYNQIQRIFPGGPTPAFVVVQARDVTAAPVQTAITAMERTALASGQMNQPIYQRISADRSTALVSIPLAGDGENAASNRALNTLRQRVIPATVGRVPGVTVNVAGTTAANKDFNTVLGQRTPLVFGFVLLLAFLLLLVSFRSVVVAGTAIVLNLLSVGAAYGVLVLLFQDGYGQGLLHFKSVGAVTAWLPLFLFVVLFGLSMDYQVFIISRIRELFDRGQPTEAAVANGIKSTAGTVSAAAVVMVFVFLTFAMVSQVSLKETGVGLATAILIDATVVRAVLLPAIMKLLGRWNWYLPGWLNHRRSVATTRTPIEAASPPVSPIDVVPVPPTKSGSILTVAPPSTPSGGQPEPKLGTSSQPVRRQGWTAWRITALVGGSLLFLISLGVLVGGGAAAWADNTQRDAAGYLTTGAHTFATPSYALTSDGIDLRSRADAFKPSHYLGTVRVRVTPVRSNQPVFVGIASKTAVDRYLAGVRREVVTNWPEGKTASVGQAGNPPAVRPALVNIWAAQSTGTGTQTLTWQSTSGRWTVVAMNADASPGLSVSADVGATAPNLGWIALGLLAGGGLLLLIAGSLIVVPVIRANRS